MIWKEEKEGEADQIIDQHIQCYSLIPRLNMQHVDFKML